MPLLSQENFLDCFLSSHILKKKTVHILRLAVCFQFFIMLHQMASNIATCQVNSTYCHLQQDQQSSHLVDLSTCLAIPTNASVLCNSKNEN